MPRFVFNPDNIDSDRLVSEGWHEAVVINASERERGDELCWNITFEIQNGRYVGTPVMSRFYVLHPSKGAVWHAKRKLRALCLATDTGGDLDSPQVFRGKKCLILVKISRYKSHEKNEIDDFKSIDGKSVQQSVKDAIAATGLNGARKIYAPPPEEDDRITQNDLPF